MSNMSAMKIPELNPDIAEKLLTNVFDSCQQEPNTIPLIKLESYSEYRRERYSFQKVLVLVLLAVFLLLPIFFISPDFDIRIVDMEELNDEPVYEVRVDNVMPVKFVSASINGHNVAVYETASHVYTMEPMVNGPMRVRVMLLNGQWVDQMIDVTTVDKDAPRLVGSDGDGKVLTLQVADDGLGIDFGGVYSEGMSGTIYKPSSIDEASGTIVFDFPKESPFIIHINDT